MIIPCREGVSAAYMQRVLASPSTITAIEGSNVGSIIINLNQHTFSGLRVALPRLEEQEAMSWALSDLDELQRSLETCITKKTALKQAAMRELLTGKQRLPGFEGDWEMKRLVDVAHIKTGSRNNEDKNEDGENPFFD
jgi:type I restriction enzyme S subunit